MITGIYNLAVNPLWKNVQQQEIFLECDTTLAPVIINLFEIADLNRFWGVKIIISDASNNASANNITINASGSDLIDELGNNQVVLATDGESVVLQVTGVSQWLATESIGGGAGGGIEDILYADLYTKIVNSQLTPGKKYRLLDYKSTNFLNGWQLANNNPTPIDPSFNPRQIYTGPNETLILEATSTYEFEPTCYSEQYPGDILQFEAFTNKIGVDFDIYNGQVLPDSTVVSGFDLQWDGTNVYFNMPTGYPALFGHYFYLYCEFGGGSYYQDGCFEPLTPVVATCQYPYTSSDPAYGYPKDMSRLSVSPDGMKVILLDLDENDFNNYDADSLYVDTIYAIGDSYGQVIRRNDTQRNVNVPFDFRAVKYRRYEVDLSSNTNNGVNYWGIGDNPYIAGSTRPTTGNYKDVFSIGNPGADIFDVTWDGIGGGEGPYWYRGECDNNVFFQTINNIIINSLRFLNNTCLYDFQESEFNGRFVSGNVLADVNKIFSNGNFISNVMGGNFQLNNFAGDFNNNISFGNFSTNDIAQNFTSNRIQYNFFKNTINQDFSNNTISSYFQENAIGIGFYNNTIANGFSRNEIGDYFNNNTTFGSFTDNSFDVGCYNTVFQDNFVRNTIGASSSVNTFSNNCTDNEIGSRFINNVCGDNLQFNKIANYVINNTFAANFQFNKIGSQFQNNTFGTGCVYNTIGEQCYSNIFQNNVQNNTIGNGNNSNTFGNTFIMNTFGNYCSGNVIGDNCSFNSFPSTFNSNTILNLFQYNQILTPTTLNFSGATHVYQNYNCTIFLNASGIITLSYVNGANTVIYTLATA